MMRRKAARHSQKDGATPIMANTDNTNDSTPTTPKAGRGRKKIIDGGKKSPHQIYCLCAAMIKGNMVVDEMHCAKSSLADPKASEAEVKAEAKHMFMEAHKEPPSVIYGPYFLRRSGSGTAPAKKRDVVTGLSLENSNLSPNRTGTAIYKGWNVSVKFVDNDPEAVYILYKNHATEEKKTKPANKFVRIDALENLVTKDRASA